MDRRGFITGLISLGVAAPAIVRSVSLMPVRGIVLETEMVEYWDGLVRRTGLPQMTWRLLNQGVPLVKNELLNDLVYHA
jgi:hypothetical protein